MLKNLVGKEKTITFALAIGKQTESKNKKPKGAVVQLG